MKQILALISYLLTVTALGQELELRVLLPADQTISYGCRSLPFHVEVANRTDHAVELGSTINPHGSSKVALELRFSNGNVYRLSSHKPTSETIGKLQASQRYETSVALDYEPWSGLKRIIEKEAHGPFGKMEFELRAVFLSIGDISIGSLLRSNPETWEGAVRSQWIRVTAYENICEPVSPYAGQSLRD